MQADGLSQICLLTNYIAIETESWDLFLLDDGNV